MFVFWVDPKATCCLIMHYIYNNNVFEIEGRSWSLTHLNQFERWWLYGCYWVVFYGFYHQIGGFGGARIFPFILKEIWSQKNSCNILLMLNFTSKSLCLILCFIGHEKRCGYCWSIWQEILISYAYQMQSSFTSYAIIWNWLCKPNGWWRLQYGFLKTN